MKKVCQYYKIAASKVSHRVCIDTMSQNNYHLITGFGLTLKRLGSQFDPPPPPPVRPPLSFLRFFKKCIF